MGEEGKRFESDGGGKGGGRGCYSILSITNNALCYIQPGLTDQSTGPERMRNHMRSSCVCTEAMGQLLVCVFWCVHRCDCVHGVPSLGGTGGAQVLWTKLRNSDEEREGWEVDECKNSEKQRGLRACFVS